MDEPDVNLPKDSKRQLTEGSVGGHLYSLTWPMVGGIVAIFTFNLADTYFVGQLGTEQLAAISFTFPVAMIVSSLAIGLGAGAASVIARAIGSDDGNGDGNGDGHSTVRRLATDGLLLSFLSIVVITIIGQFTIEPLFTLLGARPNVLGHITEYMQVWYLSMVLLVVPMVGNGILRATGDSLWPSLIMVAAAVINIIMDPLLIFGIGPFPELGIAGAAWASVIGNATVTLGSVYLLYFRDHLIHWKISPPKLLWDSWQRILFIGMPAALANMINPIGLAIVTRFLADISQVAVAAFGVAGRIESMAVVVMLALSAGIGPVVGQNWGAQQLARVRRALALAFMGCLAAGLFSAVVLFFIAPFITPPFDSNAQVQEIANTYLRLVPWTYVGYGIVIVAAAAFNAIGKPFSAAGLTAFRTGAIYVPGAWIGAQLGGITGVFIAIAASNVVAGLAGLVFSHWQCRHPDA